MSDSPRPRLGLVLSGGVVRGAAHLGVLDVLHREGLRPDCIVGTSAGALVGALYAAGYAPLDIHAVAKEFRWTSLARPTWRLWESVLDVEPFERFLRNKLHLSTFAALHTPFGAVACDLKSGRSIVLREGDVVEAVLASCAIPALFPAVERDGCQLVDGGIVNDLPVDACKTFGADVVVGVDVLPIGSGGQKASNLIEIFMRARYLTIRANHPPADAFDCLIVPDIEDYSLIDFRQLDALMAAGQAAAKKALPALHAALERPSSNREAAARA